MEKDTRNP